ncbi:Ribulokinase [Lunatimonas lonarensis]|uniref:Ribulokinase n=1 Tax=Lunatimonas lonarensis TaxID=1232681 RepID=R7ZQL9_9BACT|nr:ribulokinase [Lunatimonas lonarensis]EON76410.1 Ribulokinase [Lunatimonas lonarensis]
MKHYVIGVDYGTDSVRSVLVDTKDGKTLASEVFLYPRWREGRYCNPSTNQFRQHPLDHLEGLTQTVRKVMEQSGVDPRSVKAMCVDTTGSSPLPVNEQGVALAMLPEFSSNPNAMMVLWKDHTAIGEADEINQLARTWGGEDFTKYEGGIYSSEWFWAKILHITRKDPAVANAAYSWMEHCDYVTATLTGTVDPLQAKRSRCAAGHKALWHESWGGLPDKAFLSQLHPGLASLKDRLYTDTFTSDESAGTLCKEWADRLGLSETTIVAVGTFDAHAGAVGGQVTANTLVKVMGTSTCDIMITSYETLGNKLVKGICGQVDGSVVPGTIGLEAGQSGFGDVLAWYKNLISGPAIQLIQESKHLDSSQKELLVREIEEKLLVKLSEEALKIHPSESAVLALDWINGRRTPDANQLLKGAILGLTMGSDAAKVYKALVDAICFGSRRIVDRFRQEGIAIDSVVGLGGVAKKSVLVMQTMADVLNMPIKVATSEQAPALGAAMYAAVAGGIYPHVQAAIDAMGNGFDKTYTPNPEHVAAYQQSYEKYLSFGDFIESITGTIS